MTETTRRISSVLTNASEQISRVDVFAALADSERQQILVILHEARTPEPLSAITRSIAYERDHSGSETVQSLRIRLYHCHIPKLVETGLIDYDADRDEVELTDLGETIADALVQ